MRASGAVIATGGCPAAGGAREPGGCPMDALLRLLMGPWTTYLVWLLGERGPLRFGALKAGVPGISSRVLTERLRLLEGAGLVTRDYRPTVPPAVSYALTPRAAELRAVLDELSAIARRWGEEDAARGAAGAPAAPPATARFRAL